MEMKQIGNRTRIILSGSSVGYIVRGKNGPNDVPGLLTQHADCILSTGEPVGFFGREGPGSGGLSSTSWNSIGINQIASVLGYDQMLETRKTFVDAELARGVNGFSTILIISGLQEIECSLFNDYWRERKEAKKGSNPPFHMLGRNCSSFAHHSFEELNLLNPNTRNLFLTPNKLFHHLINFSKCKNYKLNCYSGFVGFEPHEKIRQLRRANKNTKYDIIIDSIKKHYV